MSHSVRSTSRWSACLAMLLLVAALAVLAWGYWPAYQDMAVEWRNPQYSHGYLVPVFALIMLGLRRDHLARIKLDVYPAGLPVIILAGVLRFAENYYFGQEWVDSVSLLVFLAGLALLVGGWPALRWAGPSIIFLVFMIPLPFTVEVTFSGQLQLIATTASTYVLQTLGQPALSQGSVIIINRGESLNEVRLNVVEQCSGLRMLLIFFALSTAVCFLMRGTWWEKSLVFVSAVPIALIANITRISVTGLLYVYSDEKFAQLVFHDLAGWLMMPFALILLWIELRILARLFVETRRRQPTAFPLFGARPPRRA
jgi:exosortase